MIARQIGKILNAREPKIVNGPEILDKYVGGSEEKIRALFVDAEKEEAEMGENSSLHIIILDEMDAIMKSRGSTKDSTGVSDSVVNQFLSKIDGVNSLNNILIIGMTNRKDMIDEAILRPGRLEIHIEIGLPDEHGRLQILHIKTAAMKKNGRISSEAINRLPEAAHLSKNYTGAELEGLVRNAASYALSRNIDASSANIKITNDRDIQVEWRDFERALDEIVPAFGNRSNEDIQRAFKNGFINYGPAFDDLWNSLLRLLSQVKNSVRTPLLSVLLEGSVGTGKTAVAAKLAVQSDFPFIRLISADTMIGLNESTKCENILRVFKDAYRSPFSVIILDDIERIMEYTPVGVRYSNAILQTLLVLIKKAPPAGCRLLVVSTTSIVDLMEVVQITQSFNVVLHVSQLQLPSEILAVLKDYPDLSPQDAETISRSISKPIGVKQLLMVLEMSRVDGTGEISADNFLECLHTLGF